MRVSHPVGGSSPFLPPVEISETYTGGTYWLLDTRRLDEVVGGNRFDRQHAQEGAVMGPEVLGSTIALEIGIQGLPAIHQCDGAQLLGVGT